MDKAVYFGAPPYLSAVVNAVTSEAPIYPLTNALSVTKPRRKWKSTSTSQQDLTLDLGAQTALSGMFVNRTNFPEIQVLGSNTAGSGYDFCTPNLLLWSHKPKNTAGAGNPVSPWFTQSGSATITPDAVAGPNVLMPRGQSCALTGSNAAIAQTVSMSATVQNRSIHLAVWLAVPTGTGTAVIEIATANGGTFSQTVSLSDRWSRFTVSGVPTSASDSAFQVRIRVPNSLTFYFGGAQATIDNVNGLIGDYETRANGLVVPRSSFTARRKVWLDLTGFNYRYLRFRVPASQTLDDAQSVYEIGQLLPMTGITRIAGLLFPLELAAVLPRRTTQFEGGGQEVLTLGEPYVVGRSGGTMLTLAGMSVLTAAMRSPLPTLLIDNAPPPGSHPDASDMSRAVLVWLGDEGIRPSFTIPDVFDVNLNFTEVM